MTSSTAIAHLLPIVAVGIGLMIRLLPDPDGPSRWHLGIALVWWAFALASIVAAAGEQVWPLGGWAEPVGALLLVGGLALAIVAVRQMGSLARVLGLRADRVIIAGAYRYSRHPQYLAISLALTGFALLAGSGFALALAAAMALSLLGWTSTEERRLTRALPEYSAYCAHTPLLPGLGRPVIRRQGATR